MKNASDEFIFLRDKLQKIAQLIVSGEHGDYKEASFLIGCLHSICQQNYLLFKEKEVE